MNSEDEPDKLIGHYHIHICYYCTCEYQCFMNEPDCNEQEEPFCCDVCWLPRVGIDI